MTNEAKIRVLRIYSILLGIVIVIAGLCLMAGCLSIYNSGDQPYSREIVAEVFSKIAIPIYLCLIMVILGFVLSLLLSPEKKTPVAKKARVDKDTEISEADLAKRKKLTSADTYSSLSAYALSYTDLQQAVSLMSLQKQSTSALNVLDWGDWHEESITEDQGPDAIQEKAYTALLRVTL